LQANVGNRPVSCTRSGGEVVGANHAKSLGTKQAPGSPIIGRDCLAGGRPSSEVKEKIPKTLPKTIDLIKVPC